MFSIVIIVVLVIGSPGGIAGVNRVGHGHAIDIWIVGHAVCGVMRVVVPIIIIMIIVKTSRVLRNSR